MFLHADSEGSDQTERVIRLILVFALCTGHFVGFVMLRLKCVLIEVIIIGPFNMASIAIMSSHLLGERENRIDTVPRRYLCCRSLLLLIVAVRIYTLVRLLCE